jgi:uncharacterized protein YcsI (UPF0317 family)
MHLRSTVGDALRVHIKTFCVSDISPNRARNRSDRIPVYWVCYVTEQYVPRIGYLKERVSA